jgi:hypothetical protein
MYHVVYFELYPHSVKPCFFDKRFGIDWEILLIPGVYVENLYRFCLSLRYGQSLRDNSAYPSLISCRPFLPKIASLISVCFEIFAVKQRYRKTIYG